MKTKILILGKTPPPIGGVTVHVSRLIGGLKQMHYDPFQFLDLKKERGGRIILQVFRSRIIHLHTSSPYFQFAMALFCLMGSKKLIVTYHGNWCRYGAVKNLLTALSAMLSFIPIVQNQSSLTKALRANKRSVLISSFIPALGSMPLPDELMTRLLGLRKKYKYLFCTNAWKLTFDKNGNELYGILALVHKITTLSDAALIVSDPSGTYLKYLARVYGKLPDAVFLVTRAHDFDQILLHVKGYIRNTTTDGDSISIHEALARNVAVFASDCVPRPYGCHLFSDLDALDLKHAIDNLEWKTEIGKETGANTIDKLVGIYTYCLQPGQ